jgi:hypothetical protein
MFALSVLAIALGTWGCSAFRKCQRQDFGAFYAFTCPADFVNRHCWHTIQRWEKKHGAPALMDNGKPRPANSIILGCADYKRWGKPSIFVSPEYRRCTIHEAAHALKWGTPEEVDRNWPCRGEGKR